MKNPKLSFKILGFVTTNTTGNSPNIPFKIFALGVTKTSYEMFRRSRKRRGLLVEVATNSGLWLGNPHTQVSRHCRPLHLCDAARILQMFAETISADILFF